METEDGKIYAEYRRCSNQLRRLTRKATKLFEKNIANQSKENPKAFWNYVSTKTKMRSKIPDLYYNDDEDPEFMTSNDQEKADTLGNFFSSVFTNEPEGTWELPNRPEIRYRLKLSITTESLIKKLDKLKISKSPGPDGMHPRVLSELRTVLVSPLLVIFQTSVRTGSLPAAWKDANISAIHKKGNKHIAGNYRPVSLTSIVCKLLESFVRDALIEYMKVNNLISRKQFGFLSGRSTVLQLLRVLDQWTEILDRGGCVDVIYCDFMKAFDTVPHRRLISVLQYYGVDDPALSWIKDFLTDRRQRVIVNGQSSRWHTVTSGIPQGSVLGPVLFVVYINTMVENDTVSDIYLYADDTKVFKEVNTISDSQSLQQDINSLYTWTQDSLLRFHPEKCVAMRVGNSPDEVPVTYTMGGVPLTISNEEKDLGVLIDSKLNFDRHIGVKVNKANSLVGLVRRSFEYIDPHVFKQLFKSIVRPHLEYAAPVWNPHLKKHISSVENVQRRATRMVPGLKGMSYEQRLRALDLPTLQYRRYRGDMIEVFKMTHGLYDETVTNDFLDMKPSRARGHDFNIYKLGCRLDVRKYSFRLRVTSQWNNLPDSVVNADSMNSFKNRLDKFWNDSEVMYNPDTNIYDITTSRSSRRAHHVAADEDPDLMPEA